MKFGQVFVLLSSLLLGTACGARIQHVFQDAEAIEAHLESEFPVGMNKEDVRSRLKENGAEIKAERDFYSRSDAEGCSSHLRVSLSTYRLVFRTDVIAFIGFDTADRVCDIEVEKYTDAL